MTFCTKCGSHNHTAYDCSKTDQKLQPPIAESEGRGFGIDAHAENPNAIATLEPAPMFETVPRFKDCPPICTHANLPSFINEAALLKWQGQFDGHKIKKKWLCQVCNHWHFKATPRGPSGSSSGGERDSEMPDSWRPPKLLPPSRLSEDLPRHEVTPEPEKEKPLQKPKKAQSKPVNELF